MMQTPYIARRPGRDWFGPVRTLNYHAVTWGDASRVTPQRPVLVMVHGWMDVGASFQFVVDALAGDRFVVAPDWRGFGLTEAPGADCYWFPDYLGDLDALLDTFSPGAPVDLVGHSMGGNVVMTYAGVRPQRIRKLVNLEGFGLPQTQPHHAPRRLVQWLDELKTPQQLRSYPSLEAVAERLMKNNARLSPDRAAWLAPHWARQRADGQWHILGDPAHKLVNPTLYRKDEALETWKLITAPVLWVEGADTDMARFWGDRYPRADFEERLTHVRTLERCVLQDCGHMLHHDQPAALAQRMVRFLEA